MTLHVLICTSPCMFAIGGITVFAREAIGPFITVVVWLAMILAIIVRNSRSRSEHYVSWFELVPVLGIVVVLQLLLDLHTPYLGDIIVAALHAGWAIAALIRWRHRAR